MTVARARSFWKSIRPATTSTMFYNLCETMVGRGAGTATAIGSTFVPTASEDGQLANRVAQLIAEIHKLPKADQDRIVQRIHQYQRLNGTYTEARQPEPRDSTLILEVLSKFLESRGIEYTPVSVLAKSSGYKSYQERVGGVCGWLDQQHLTRNQKRQLLGFAFECLHADLKGMRIPIGSRLMMQSINMLPVVMERAFPGYAALGLLKHVVADGGSSG